ncbi:tyrosinase family protein [Aquibium sp. ELW1220]|uniref:tyrosinase family protein n=1 Tax=Aquibium sp. ELW1220 TaxID=2976766 RepID=UPI0025B14DBF|nr:tyrosinase family protein [Aquibium sp. ELW1220]MDN2584298.1 tyrosinase family protein [Aquibium sp. ELW1220]
MSRVRRSVWSEGPGWNETLIWYAKAVGVMTQRPVTERTSWRFLAGMHGYHEGHWRALGVLKPEETLPGGTELDMFWSKCQHGSWYFLPWHRGYLSAFEQIVLSAVVEAGGPQDWALPYWNYSSTAEPNARKVHPAFTAPNMPDGTPNPLYTRFRFGNSEAGEVILSDLDVDLGALSDSVYSRGWNTAGGFGGGGSATSHNAGQAGSLERTPHGNVHTAVGGAAELPGLGEVPGFMSLFETAGLDPLFWLHHANIDRLWEVWLKRDQKHRNPDDARWLGGPMDRPFVMPRPDGSEWHFASAEMVATDAPLLNYVYDDVSDPLVVTAGLTEGLVPPAHQGEVEAVDTQLIGTNGTEIRLGAGGATTEVAVDEQVLRRASEQMTEGPEAAAAAGAFFLTLESIRGLNNVAIYQVEVDYGAAGGELPSGEARAMILGSFSTFGLGEASALAEGNDGMTLTFDITKLVQRMGFDTEPNLDRLRVSIVPRSAARGIEPPTIGRVNIYQDTP